MDKYILRNDKAQIVTVAPKDILFRYLKHACPDGEYSVEGPNIDCTITRKDGILYPSSGSFDGVRFAPLQPAECQEIFNRFLSEVKREEDYDDDDLD